MKTFAKIAVRTILILIAICVLLIIILRLFGTWQMRNDTMKPLIASNDVVFATKWFHASSLHNGDLVVVNAPIPTGQVVPTVRQIEQQSNTPSGQFYLRAVNTNGLDSQLFGALPATNILGKVIWIIKAFYLPPKETILTATPASKRIFTRPVATN